MGGRGSLRVAVVLAGSVAAGGAFAASGDDLVGRGRHIAEAACSPCHAIDREGPSATPEAPPFRELGRKYPVDSLQEALAEGVVVGHPGMPEVRMNETDIAAFLAWLKSAQVP